MDARHLEMTRREMLKVAGLGAAAGLAPMTASAQSGGPRRGGSVTVAHPGTIRQLDPQKQTSADEYIMAYHTYETLVWWNHDGTLQPLLARAWEKSPDLRTWTFHLRQGVKFHNGKDLTSADAKASIERILDPKTGSLLRSTLDMVDAVETPDAVTVRIRLKVPYSELDSVLSLSRMAIVPSDKIDVLSKEVIGTGAYTLQEFVQGSHFSLARNPNYWRANLPYLDTIVVRQIPEAATRLTSLQSGQTDVFWLVPFELFDSLKSARGITLHEATTNFWDPLVMNPNKPPFDNPKVRKAVRLALDKDRAITLCLRGHGQKVILPLVPSDPHYPSQAKDPEPNLAEARKLLAEAGHPNGFEVPMFIGMGRPARERMAEVVCDMLKAVNITCKIQRMPIDKFFAEIEGKGELYATGYPASPAAGMHLYPVFHSTGSFNAIKWKHPQVDQILEQARQTAAPEKARELYVRLADLLNEEGPMWIPWVQNIVIATRDRVRGFRAWHDFRVWLGESWVEA
jgi:peptide/nickel transport system substrate-binding protein